MIISLKDVRQAFDDLLDGKRSRKIVSAWAFELVRSDDEDSLVFEPQAESDLIRSALSFLVGVDLINPCGGYLYEAADFEYYKP